LVFDNFALQMLYNLNNYVFTRLKIRSRYCLTKKYKIWHSVFQSNSQNCGIGTKCTIHIWSLFLRGFDRSSKWIVKKVSHLQGSSTYKRGKWIFSPLMTDPNDFLWSLATYLNPQLLKRENIYQLPLPLFLLV